MSTVQITLALAILAVLEYVLWRTIKGMGIRFNWRTLYAEFCEDGMHDVAGMASITKPRRAK